MKMVRKNLLNYASWFDYVRLPETVGNKDTVPKHKRVILLTFHLPSRNDIDKDTSTCGQKYFTEEVKQSLGNQKYLTEAAKTKKKEPPLKHIYITFRALLLQCLIHFVHFSSIKTSSHNCKDAVMIGFWITQALIYFILDYLAYIKPWNNVNVNCNFFYLCLIFFIESK